MQVRVAVLLPYRDVAPWLDEAIDSVRAESVVERLVLVDDGSIDESPRIAAMHARRDPRLVCLEAHGRGLVPALELARAHADALYLARMDGDDVSVPGRIAASVAHLEAHPDVGAVGCLVEPFPSEHVAEGMRRYVAWQNGVLSPRAHRDALFVEAPLCHPSVTLRASALEAVGGYRDGPFPEDYELWLRLDRAGHGLAKLPRLGLRWRHRAERLTFADPRYGLAQHRAIKARYLAARLRELPRARAHGFVVWGAGPTGKRLARDLEAHEARTRGFIDIDPDKIGRTRRGTTVAAPSSLDATERPFVVIAVGARGARELITRELEDRGLLEGDDYLAAS